MQYGTFLCQAHHANMTLLHVIPAKPTVRESPSRTLELLDNKLQALSKEIKMFNGNTVETEVLMGNVSHELAKYLRKSSFDMVVMGLNGNGGLNKELGKNTKLVLEKADVPILVLPNKPYQTV